MQKSSGNYFKKVTSESVVQLVINSLTEAMIDRKLRPGDKLPTEAELAESLGVGRNSIREAIKILEYLGVLEIHRAEGTFVCEGFAECMIDPLIYGIILNTSDSYEHLNELREMMEVAVMQRAVEKHTEEELQELKEILDKMKAEITKGSDNVEKVFEWDNQFHMKISEIGHNPLVDKINNIVRVLTYTLRLETVKSMLESGRGEELYEAHEKLYTMLLQRDAENMRLTVRGSYFPEVRQKAAEK